VIVNLVAAAAAILIAFHLKDPARFTLFPTLLLLTIASRGALSLAATRLIVQFGGQPGRLGQLIPTFGGLATGQNLKLACFLVLMLWLANLWLLPRAREQVAQMAASFTLDSLPGQQMQIDADLMSGQLDSDAAQARRRKVEHLSDYFEAMGGVSLILSFEIQLGLLLTVINLGGGLAVGGLKQLVPLLSLSVGASLLATLSAFLLMTSVLLCSRRTALQNQIWRFMGGAEGWLRNLLLMVAGALFTFELVRVCASAGLPPVHFFVLSGLIHLCVKAQLRDMSMSMSVSTKNPPPQLVGLVKGPVEPISLEVGRDLLAMLDPNQGSSLLARIPALRSHLYSELGLILPAVRFRDNLKGSPDQYTISVNGQAAAQGITKTGHLLVLGPESQLAALPGVAVNEPTYGLPAVWIKPQQISQAESGPCQIFDPESVIATHLCETVRRHAAELLCRKSLQSLLDGIQKVHPGKVQRVLRTFDLSLIHGLLQNLLREQVSIKDLPAILDCLCEVPAQSTQIEPLTEMVRARLRHGICQSYADSGTLRVVRLSRNLESRLLRATDSTIDPSLGHQLSQALAQALKAHQLRPILLTEPGLRPRLRRLLQSEYPELVVLSHHEIAPGFAVESTTLQWTTAAK